MISLLHELLGYIEISKADWLRIRRLGPVRFVMQSCLASFSGRVGAGVILVVAVSCLDSGGIIGGWFARLVVCIQILILLMFGCRIP